MIPRNCPVDIIFAVGIGGTFIVCTQLYLELSVFTVYMYESSVLSAHNVMAVL